MTSSDPSFDVFPRESGGWITRQASLSPVQFFLLPVMNGDYFGSGRKVVPQIFHKLKFFRRTQIKDRYTCHVHPILS